MDALRPYAKAVVVVATPSLVFAAAFQLPAALGAAMAALAASALVSPSDAKEGLRDGLKGLVLIGVLAALMGLTAIGLGLFLFGLASSVMWMVLTGAAASLTGGVWTSKARGLFAAWFIKPEPPVVRPRPLPPPTPTWVEMAKAYASPPPPPPLPPPPPPPKPMPRPLVEWGRRLFPAYQTDEGNYMISAPPGRGKTTILRMLLKPMIEEVLDPRCRSTLILFDPKREAYSWVASEWPQDSPVPLHLFCPSDQRTVTLDWSLDFPTLAARETFALSLFPKNPHETQPFFGNASRTAVEGAITALEVKLGTWDVRSLALLLSNPAYMRKLIGEEKTTRFIAELLSTKSEETAQNVQMEITSRLSKWRKLAAHLSRVDARKKLSLDRFLQRPGVLVIQKDDDFAEQHDAMNSMLLQRMGQLLKKLPEDPERKRKVYVVVDEFPSLGCIEGLDSMCRELRSRGVVFVFIWQSWANMVDVWKQKADTIQGTLQNFMILGSADYTDAKHAAELIGKVRGREPQRTEGRSSGTNSSRTDGVSDVEGWSVSATRAAYEPKKPRPIRPGSGPGFVATNTYGVSGSKSRSRSDTQGESEQTSSGVTWVYFDRDIKSPTDVMRTPLPTGEGWINGVSYCAGEPAPWDFVYTKAEVDAVLHKRNRFIPDYHEWPAHYQVIEEFTPWELEKLGLEDLPAEGPGSGPAGGPSRDARPDGRVAPQTPRKAVERLLELLGAEDGDWDAVDEDDEEG